MAPRPRPGCCPNRLGRLAAPLGAALLTCAASACGGTAGGARNEAYARPEPVGNDEVMRDDTPAQHGTGLSVSLDADPEVRVGDGEPIDLHVRITNEGDEPIDLDALAAQLRVDDVPAAELRLGGHGWHVLQPGQTAEWDQPTRGVRLLEDPGEHTLRLEIGDSISPPVPVRVVPVRVTE